MAHRIPDDGRRPPASLHIVHWNLGPGVPQLLPAEARCASKWALRPCGPGCLHPVSIVTSTVTSCQEIEYPQAYREVPGKQAAQPEIDTDARQVESGEITNSVNIRGVSALNDQLERYVLYAVTVRYEFRLCGVC